MKVSPRWFWLVFVFLATQLVYLRTLNPTFPNDDSAETITAGATLGLQHPPGYALAAIMGRCESLWPLGSFGFRANWGASLLASLGAVLLTLIIFWLLKTSWFFKMSDSDQWIAAFCAVVGGLSLAFSPTYWQNALSAKGGIYLFSICLQLLILTGLLHAAQKENRLRVKIFAFSFFLIGLGLANHWETLVIFIPAIILFFILNEKIKISGWIKAGSFLVLGLSPLLYLPLRAHLKPVLNLGAPNTFSLFCADLSRSYISYREISFFKILWNVHDGTSSWSQVVLLLNHIAQTQGVLLINHFKTDFGWLFGLLALIGMGRWVLIQERKILLFLTVSLFSLLLALFSFLMLPPEINTPWIWGKFFLSFNWMIFLWTSMGLAWVILQIRNRNKTGSWWFASFLAGYLILNVGPQWIALDQHHEILAYDYGENILKSLPADSLFFAESDEDYFSLYYLQQVEHHRPDVIMIPTFTLFEPWGVKQVEKENPSLGLTASIASFPDHFARIIYATSEIVVKNRTQRLIAFSGFNGAFHRYYLDLQKNTKVRSSGLIWLLDNSLTRNRPYLKLNQLRVRDAEDLSTQSDGSLKGLRYIYALAGIR